ncbi:B9D2 protein, partial [Sakesphorus luctuosus]|nr:B9D2 protein [Sakesphorus luctuosus]
LGYGVVPVPTSPGWHELDVVTWSPRGGWHDRLRQKCLGGGPQLRTPKLGIVAGGAERFRLRTESAGTVRVGLGVLPRNFGSFGVAL